MRIIGIVGALAGVSSIVLMGGTSMAASRPAVMPLANSNITTIYMPTPAGQGAISTQEQSFINGLPMPQQTDVRDLIRANQNGSLPSFLNSSTGLQLKSAIKNTPELMGDLFSVADANNPQYWTRPKVSIQPGQEVKYVFPDGSEVVESLTRTTLSTPSASFSNRITIPDASYIRAESGGSITKTSLGNYHYQFENTRSIFIGIAYVQDHLYTDVIGTVVGNNIDIDIYNTSGTADAIGFATAVSNGDTHTVYNNTDHAWAQGTFSNDYEVDGVGYSGTETMETLFNGANSTTSYTATVNDF